MSDTVTLREITSDNEARVKELAVGPGQRAFVRSISQSLEDAAANPEAKPWYRAIYADDQPVGFVMLSFDVPPGRSERPWRYYVWRLLVDARDQRRGYGRAAMELVIDIVRGSPGGTELYTSIDPGEGAPVAFYRSLGFEPTGEWLEREEVLRLSIDRVT